jgi:hypothetical protein
MIGEQTRPCAASMHCLLRAPFNSSTLRSVVLQYPRLKGDWDFDSWRRNTTCRLVERMQHENPKVIPKHWWSWIWLVVSVLLQLFYTSCSIFFFLICIVGGGIKVHSTLRPLNGLWCQPRVIMMMEKSVE